MSRDGGWVAVRVAVGVMLAGWASLGLAVGLVIVVRRWLPPRG